MSIWADPLYVHTYSADKANSDSDLILFFQLATVMLPEEENFLLLFRRETPLDNSVEFMRVRVKGQQTVQRWMKDSGQPGNIKRVKATEDVMLANSTYLSLHYDHQRANLLQACP